MLVYIYDAWSDNFGKMKRSRPWVDALRRSVSIPNMYRIPNEEEIGSMGRKGRALVPKRSCDQDTYDGI